MHATNQKGIQHYKSGVDPVRQFAPMLLNLPLAQPAHILLQTKVVKIPFYFFALFSKKNKWAKSPAHFLDLVVSSPSHHQRVQFSFQPTPQLMQFPPGS